MEQCGRCIGHLFFEPMPNDIFAFCQKYGEGIKDIDLKTGASPAIKKHGLENILCEKFKKGKSVCHTSEKHPFLLHSIRKKGEKDLLMLLT